MLSFGVYQFFVEKNVKKLSVYNSVLYVHIVMVFFGLAAFFFQKPVMPSKNTFLLLLFLGVLGSLNLPLLFKAIKIGKLSLVIPLANVYAVFAVIFSYLFFGETLRLTQYIGGLIVLIGVVLILTRISEIKGLHINKKDIKPMIYALIFSVGLGLYAALLRPIEEGVGPYMGFFYTEAIILGFLLFYPIIKKNSFEKPKKNIYKFVILAGLMQAIGSLAFFLGVSFAKVSITSMIGAANPLITISLASLFLKEKLEINQLVGAITTIIGLVILAL